MIAFNMFYFLINFVSIQLNWSLFLHCFHWLYINYLYYNCSLFITAKVKSGHVLNKGRGPRKENGRIKFEEEMEVELDIDNVKRGFKLKKKKNVEKDRFEVRYTWPWFSSYWVSDICLTRRQHHQLFHHEWVVLIILNLFHNRCKINKDYNPNCVRCLYCAIKVELTLHDITTIVFVMSTS